MYLGLICTIKGVAGPGSLVNMRVRVMRYVVRKRERERERVEREEEELQLQYKQPLIPPFFFANKTP